MTDGIEIERKFLLEDPSIVSSKNSSIIAQGYLVIAGGGEEVRIRNRDNNYTLTYKAGSGRVRTEREISLTAEQFGELWPATEGRRVEKERFLHDENGLIFEIDIYKNELRDLRVVEIEFANATEAERFQSPVWLGLEVTDDRRYKNQYLAVNGAPESE